MQEVAEQVEVPEPRGYRSCPGQKARTVQEVGQGPVARSDFIRGGLSEKEKGEADKDEKNGIPQECLLQGRQNLERSGRGHL